MGSESGGEDTANEDEGRERRTKQRKDPKYAVRASKERGAGRAPPKRKRRVVELSSGSEKEEQQLEPRGDDSKLLQDFRFVLQTCSSTRRSRSYSHTLHIRTFPRRSFLFMWTSPTACGCHLGHPVMKHPDFPIHVFRNCTNEPTRRCFFWSIACTCGVFWSLETLPGTKCCLHRRHLQHETLILIHPKKLIAIL